ncbi:hypothetical protein [Sandaracinus amylolyticus]|uniref:hypothetical protein n=1 Tax=Sandaracinus amylolyticus TaxID=927083 RepID=UPI001F18D3DD|nr:hypothetical protein [Sandaracinus amylolyticus]UJR79860.1 Hypothetical protein I5071_18990 [Sandaracinus amylolyticus]
MTATRRPEGAAVDRNDVGGESETLPPRGGKVSPLTPTQARLAEQIARLAALGHTNAEIGAKVDRSERQVRWLRAHPGFAAAVVAAREALRAEALLEAEAGRVEAVKAARAVLRRFNEGGEPVAEAVVMAAAKLVIAAGAPPSETQRARARALLLSQLPADVRERVLEHLDAGEARVLRAMTDAELLALAGEP